MKVLILFTLVALTASAFDSNNLGPLWKKFKVVHGKNYSDNEERTRRQIFERNVADIIDHNLEAQLGLHSYRKGLNEYSDMTHEEFVIKMNGYLRSNRTRKPIRTVMSRQKKLPLTVDWRKEGYVTPVKSQGQCGACWAFATTGSLEGQHKNKTGKLVSLSEQNLVDCSKLEGNNGCNGGDVPQALEYVTVNGGVDTEASYPYMDQVGKCRFSKRSIGATCIDYGFVPPDERSLQEMVATVGPITVGVDSSLNSFQFYSGGVYDDNACSSAKMNHGMLVVGYGTENGRDYWIIKNSWGTSWGEDGYMRMSRNNGNLCGIADEAYYPIV